MMQRQFETFNIFFSFYSETDLFENAGRKLYSVRGMQFAEALG